MTIFTEEAEDAYMIDSGCMSSLRPVIQQLTIKSRSDDVPNCHLHYRRRISLSSICRLACGGSRTQIKSLGERIERVVYQRRKRWKNLRNEIVGRMGNHLFIRDTWMTPYHRMNGYCCFCWVLISYFSIILINCGTSNYGSK